MIWLLWLMKTPMTLPILHVHERNQIKFRSRKKRYKFICQSNRWKESWVLALRIYYWIFSFTFLLIQFSFVFVVFRSQSRHCAYTGKLNTWTCESLSTFLRVIFINISRSMTMAWNYVFCANTRREKLCEGKMTNWSLYFLRAFIIISRPV